ncbi:unnamed protein product [Mytilus coruscus]|uniref:Uncharacterized protein n=1 Tax=Mytilus coruscus TaxID=42192 RepID=A0A6J7ZZ14_MYTCO|nr:unnamed protein product [Mytilus coruscus]
MLVFSSEGSIVKTIRFKKSYRPFGVTYVVKDRIAVSFPSSEKIKILDTMEYRELKEIKLDKPCWGIHSVDDLIYVAIRSTEILVLDLAGKTVKTIPANQQNLIYLLYSKTYIFFLKLKTDAYVATISLVVNCGSLEMKQQQAQETCVPTRMEIYLWPVKILIVLC